MSDEHTISAPTPWLNLRLPNAQVALLAAAQVCPPGATTGHVIAKAEEFIRWIEQSR